jgi:hypothetical protein
MTNALLDVDPPLSLEPVVGWRAWPLDRVGGELSLRSVTRPDHWPAREAMVARCLQHRGTAPDWHCTCGLYATASPEQLAMSGVLGEGISVVGTVAMWGRIIEYTLGTRSRFAYPARLRLVCGRCLALGAGAVAPVRVLGEHGSLTAVCEAHWSGPAARADPAADVEAELLSTYGVELLPIEQLSGGLRAWPIPIPRRRVPVVMPATIPRRRVPVVMPATTERSNAWWIVAGVYFVTRVIGTLQQPTAADASAAPSNVASSPSALGVSSTSTTSHIRNSPETSDPSRPSRALRWVGAPPRSIESWPRWLGPANSTDR